MRIWRTRYWAGRLAWWLRWGPINALVWWARKVDGWRAAKEARRAHVELHGEGGDHLSLPAHLKWLEAPLGPPSYRELFGNSVWPTGVTATAGDSPKTSATARGALSEPSPGVGLPKTGIPPTESGTFSAAAKTQETAEAVARLLGYELSTDPHPLFRRIENLHRLNVALVRAQEQLRRADNSTVGPGAGIGLQQSSNPSKTEPDAEG